MSETPSSWVGRLKLEDYKLKASQGNKINSKSPWENMSENKKTK